jgi:Double zinc ribbon
MSHVVTLKQHPADADVIYLCTPPDMAHTMGGFGPARYVGNAPPISGASYAITAGDLDRFRVYCANRSVSLIDARGNSNAERPYGRGAPLPECSQCGQPARRGTRLQHCPNCGAPWQAIEIGAPYAHAGNGPHIVCSDCQTSTPAGYSHCVYCGTAHA